MTPDPLDPIPQRRPFYHRHWTTYNRPYSGCGCLWIVLVILFIWWICGWALGGGGFWGGYGTHRVPVNNPPAAREPAR